MDIWWSSLTFLQRILFFIAAPATIILVIQTILVLIGHGGEHDSDSSDVSGLHDSPDISLDHDISDISIDHDVSLDHDIDHDVSVDHDHDGHSTGHESGFSLFSVRGIMAFFAVGGFLGIAMLDSGVSEVIAMLVSLAGGFLALLMIAYLMHTVSKLQSSGNMDIHNSIGKTATVYLPISEKQAGKVTVTFQERFTELKATGSEELATGTFVKIVKVIDNETVYVEKILNTREEN